MSDDDRVDPITEAARRALGGDHHEPMVPLDEIEADLGIDADRIALEEAIAARRLSSIEAGRRKAGFLGAAAAGAMLGLRDIYEGPPKDDDVVEVAESPGEPGDIDRDGISGSVGEVDYESKPGGLDGGDL